MRKAAFLYVLIAWYWAPAGAAVISTHSFANCSLPDTNQIISYTDTFGEDHDYHSSRNQLSYAIYNPVGTSSVTVDNRTGLMWIYNRNDAGLGGGYNWLSALPACENLTYAAYKDWRLPNARELSSIIDYTRDSPALVPWAFPDANGSPSWQYWTSTTYNGSTLSAFAVSFSDGFLASKTSSLTSYAVRCVRGGL